MRLELELYADRLARQAQRLRDDIDGARTRMAWAALEAQARRELAAADCCLLEALGVWSGADVAAEERLVERRLRQLRALERLQALVERELASLAAGSSERSGASEASRPPSSS
jgi:hypothetical protein